MGDANREINKLQAAIQYYEKALEITEEWGDKELETRAYFGLGQAYRENNQIQTGIECYEKVLKIALQLDDPKKKFDAYLGLGRSFSHIGETESSRGYLLKALILSEQIKDKSLEKEVYENLGSLYYKNGMLDAVVECYVKVQKILNDLGRGKEESDVCLLLGDIFQEMEQYEKAIKSHQSALNISKNLGDEEIQIVASKKLGKMYLSVASVSSKNGDYETATKYYQKAWVLCGTQPIDDQLREQALTGLAEASFNRQSNEEAMRSIDEPKNVARAGAVPGEY